MNRREAIAASIAVLFAPKRLVSRTADDFDPFYVWRQSARFDSEVLSKVQRRLGIAMAESIDRSWSK